MVKPDFIVIMDAHPTEDGRIQKHIRFLRENGYVVYHLHVIPYPSDKGPDDSTYSLFGEMSLHINLHWKTRIKGLRLMNYLSLFSPILGQKMAEHIRALGIPPAGRGIIHVHDPILLPVAGKIRSGILTNCVIVYDRHEVYDDMKKIAGISGYGLFEKMGRKHVAAVVVVSDQHRKSAEASFPGIPMITVQNFPYAFMFDKEKIRQKIENVSDTSPILCSYIGSLRNDYDRDISLLLDVSEVLLEKNPRILVTIGGRSDTNELSDRLSRMMQKFPRRFRYLGPVPYDQVARITEDSHIGFYFLKDQKAGHVGSPNKVYEYLFCGAIPVIKGSVDLMEEYSPCSVICRSGQGPDEIGFSILTILSDPRSFQKLMDHAHGTGLQLTWDQVAGRYLQLYDEIL